MRNFTRILSPLRFNRNTRLLTFLVLTIIGLLPINNLLYGATITSTTSGGLWSAGTTWVGGLLPTSSKDVVIAAGATVNIDATAACNNLTINSTGKLWETGTGFQLRVYGTSLVCDGILGDANASNSQVELSTYGASAQTLTISGGGSIYFWKITPHLSGTTTIFDANTTVTYATTSITTEATGGINGNTYTINAGKILTLAGNLSPAGSVSAVGAGNTTVNVNGTLTVGGGLNPITANGKTFSVIVGSTGALNITGALKIAPTTSVQAPTITVASGGIITASGTVDCSNLTYPGAITGAGTFTLASGGTINIGQNLLDPTTGAIRTTTRNFNGTCSFVGTSAQATGGDLITNNLTINNAAGVTLSGSTTVNGACNLTAGALITGANTLTLKSTSPVTSGTIDGTSGTIVYNGALGQTAGGLTNVTNLIINNSAGVTLGASTTVNGTLTMTSGLLTTSSNTLTMSSASSILGASSSSYVKGNLAMIYGSTGSKTFPVGMGGNYRPVIINATSLDVTPSTFTVNQTESAWSGTLPAYTISTLARNWTIAQIGSTTYAYNLTLDGTGFSPAGTAKILENNAGTVSSFGTSGTYTASGLSSVGSFGLGDYVAVNPTVTATNASAFTTTTATFNGNITSDGGAAITERGFCYKTSSGVILTDNQNVEGSTATGTYSKGFTGFAVNTQYFYKAYATNTAGTALSSTEISLYTLADVPITPTLNNPTSTSIDVAVNLSTNPSNTQFAIYETSTSQYVQTDGTLGAIAAWQIAGIWGTKTVSGLTPSTSYTFEVKARNGDNTETTFGLTASLSTTSSSSPVLSVNAVSGSFGSQCLNSTTGPFSFTITGTTLTTDPVTVGALSGFSYSTTSGGTYTSTLSISQSGGAFSQQIFVKFTPTSVQTYNGNIAVGGGGATTVNCAVTGTGINTAPTVTTTSPATAITNTTVTLSGNVSDAGCQTISARGFCYGTLSNPDLTGSFTTETGTTGTVSSNITGLTPATTYHFRAYATSSAGTSYGTDASFITLANAPSAQPTNISFSTVLPTSFTVSFTAASGGADNYLVLRGTSAPSGTPVNGTSYTLGQTNIGSGTNTVVYVGPLTTFNETGLTANTTYYYTIYSYNGTGLTASYLTTSPATANQLTAHNQITSTKSGNWSSTSTWVGSIVPGQYDDVIIAAGHTIELSANATCNNLTINSTGKLVSAAAKTLVIKGSTLTCDGTLGDAVPATSSLTIEFSANLNIKGAGTSIYIYKLKPTTALSNIGVTFDATVTVTGTGSNILYDNTSNDNIFYTVNSPCTLTLATNFGLASSINTPSTASGTLTINTGATVNVTGSFAPNMASGKTFTGKIDGTLAVTGSSNLYSTATSGGIASITVNGIYTAANLNVTPLAAVVAPVVSIGSDGTITVNGTADFSSTTVTGAITGTGTFKLGSGATINIAAVAGLDPSTGPIRTSKIDFNSAANYSYVGSLAQTTGNDLPSTINNLTINNAAGVTLSGSTTVNGILILTAGTLTNTVGLTLGNLASIVRYAGSLSTTPTFGTAVNLTYGATTTQSGTTAVSSSSVTLSSSNSTISVGMTVTGTGISNGTTVAAISGTTLTLSQNANSAGTNTLTFSYNSAQTTGVELPTSTNVLSNLTIKNAAGVTMGASATVNGTMALTVGTLSIGSNTLTLRGATSGTGIIDTGSGTLTYAGTAEQSLDGANVISGAVNNLVVNAGSKLTTTGTLTATNLTINSDVNGTGTLKGTLTSNNATVNQSFQHASGLLRTWYVTPPVASATPSGMSIIKSYDEGTFAWSSHTQTMLAKVGYQVVPAAAANDIAFTGVLNNGNQDITLTSRTGTDNKAGFNLIGNPYPSYLDWNQVTANSENTALTRSTTMWYRTKSGGAYGFWTVNGDGVGSPNGASRYIPPMQAFWVRANEGGGTLALTSSMCTHAPASDKLLKAPASNNADIQLLRLQVDNGANTDEAVLYFSSNAANSLDKYDAPKMSNDNLNIPEIYTMLGTEHFVINAMNTIPLNTPIGLGFVPGSATSFSIKANEVSNLPANVNVILKDNVTLAETDLTDGTAAYKFSPETSSSDRFSVIFRTTGVATGLINNKDNSMLVYCNNNHGLTIRTNDEKLIGSLVLVYNALGQQLISKKLSGTIMSIDFDYTPDVYIVKVNNVITKVIVK